MFPKQLTNPTNVRFGRAKTRRYEMRSTRHLTDEEIRTLLFAPMSDEEAARLREIRKSDRWLLALNLHENGSRGGL